MGGDNNPYGYNDRHDLVKTLLPLNWIGILRGRDGQEI